MLFRAWESEQYWNSTTLLHSYSVQHWFLNTGCIEYEYNVDIILLLQIHKFRKILIILIIDSNHSSTFTVLVVAAFTKKEEKKKNTKTARKASTKPSTEYCSVNMIRIILISCFVYMLVHRELKSTTLCVLLSMSMMSISNFEYV